MKTVGVLPPSKTRAEKRLNPCPCPVPIGAPCDYRTTPIRAAPQTIPIQLTTPGRAATSPPSGSPPVDEARVNPPDRSSRCGHALEGRGTARSAVGDAGTPHRRPAPVLPARQANGTVLGAASVVGKALPFRTITHVGFVAPVPNRLRHPATPTTIASTPSAGSSRSRVHQPRCSRSRSTALLLFTGIRG